MEKKWQYVSSRSNPTVVSVSKLKDKKYRRELGLFRFDGIKLFSEAVRRGAPIECVLTCETASESVRRAVEESNISADLYTLSEPAFERITDERSPEGIVTVCGKLPNIAEMTESEAAQQMGNTALVLESVRDAGNIGTIMRTADALGVDTLILTADCADIYNSKTVRGAMGALFTQNIIIVDSAEKLACEMKKIGIFTCAAALHREARTLGSIEFPPRAAIFVGNEGHGLAETTVDACDIALLVPMREGAESLNAAVAAAICAWELCGRNNKG